MMVRTLIAGIGAVAVVGSGGFLLTTAASAQSTPHVLKFVTVEVNAVGYSANTYAGSDEDYSISGQLIGFDVLHLTTNPVSGKVKIDAAVDLGGGVINGELTSPSPTSLTATGRVTSGTGAYRGATGIITAVTESATKSVITVVFTN